MGKDEVPDASIRFQPTHPSPRPSARHPVRGDLRDRGDDLDDRAGRHEAGAGAELVGSPSRRTRRSSEKPHLDPPPRIRILDVQPSVDGGRFDVKRTLGEPVVASAEVFRDGHDQVRAVLRTRPPGGEWEETPMAWVDREVDGDRWVGTFTPDREGIWTFEVGAFTERFATWHDEVSRKRAAPGEEDLSSEVAEGALLLREAAPRVERGRRPADRRRARDRRGRLEVPEREARRRPRAAPARGARTQPRPPRLRHRQPAHGRGGARARPLRRLVRALPAQLGRLRRRPRAAAEARRARLRRALPAADPPDRRDQPQGPEQRPRRRPRRSRQPLGDRLRARRPRGDRPRPRRRLLLRRPGRSGRTRWGSRSPSTSRSTAAPTTPG